MIAFRFRQVLRVYLTDPLRKRKQGAETVVATFSDHFAFIVRLNYPHQTIPRKSRLWRMNITLLVDNTFRDTLCYSGANGKRRKNFIQTRRHVGINMSSTGYDRLPNVKSQCATVIGNIWKTFIMQQFTMH